MLEARKTVAGHLMVVAKSEGESDQKGWKEDGKDLVMGIVPKSKGRGAMSCT